jgi:hypothetical protein
MFLSSQPINRRESFRHAAAMLGVLAAAPRLSWAHEVSRGFDQIAVSTASLTEQKRQRNLWVLEVQLKPMRMVWIDSTAGRDREQIWYLAYRAVNRPLTGLTDDDTDPVNELDPIPQKPLFIPEVTIVTYQDAAMQVPEQVLRDVILPPAVKAINRTESHRPGEPVLKDSVSSIQPVPDPVEHGASGEWIYGVATWRGVDPNTDFFKVILDGFTNGYEKRENAAGQPQLWRKVLVQKFKRPGDRFDPNQQEFEFVGKPTWEYLPAGGIDAIKK